MEDSVLGASVCGPWGEMKTVSFTVDNGICSSPGRDADQNAHPNTNRNVLDLGTFLELSNDTFQCQVVGSFV